MSLNGPAHPGEHIVRDCSEPFELSLTTDARARGISRWNVSEIIESLAPVTRGFATRLAKALSSTAHS